jgi:hypothetical protein
MPGLEKSILLQPRFIDNLGTAIYLDLLYLYNMASFDLIHKGNFSIVFSRKSKVLSTDPIGRVLEPMKTIDVGV